MTLRCTLVGHAVEAVPDGGYRRRGRRGAWVPRYRLRCALCDCGDRQALRRHGLLRPAWPHRLRWRLQAAMRAARWWCRYDCDACGRPEIRWGRPAGDHRRCDPIPF